MQVTVKHQSELYALAERFQPFGKLWLSTSNRARTASGSVPAAGGHPMICRSGC